MISRPQSAKLRGSVNDTGSLSSADIEVRSLLETVLVVDGHNFVGFVVAELLRDSFEVLALASWPTVGLCKSLHSWWL